MLAGLNSEQITREQVQLAMEQYLNKGGTIEKIDLSKRNQALRNEQQQEERHDDYQDDYDSYE